MHSILILFKLHMKKKKGQAAATIKENLNIKALCSYIHIFLFKEF